MVFFRTPPCSVRLTPFPDVCVAECVLGLRVLSWFCSRHALVRWSTTSLVSMPSGVASWFSERGNARGSGLARHATTCHRQVAVSPRAPQLLTHGRSFSPSCTGVPRHVCLSQLVECRMQCSLCFPADHHANPFRRWPGCSARRVREWFAHCVVPPLDRTLHDRLFFAAASLAVHHVDLGSQKVNSGAHPVVYGRSSASSHARHWGLSWWGHDPFPGGRADRHLGSSMSCVFLQLNHW